MERGGDFQQPRRVALALQYLTPFRPRTGWGNAHVQSMLPSVRPRWMLPGKFASLRSSSRELMLECGDGVRLQAFASDSKQATEHVVVLLHGWEGSADSYYVQSLALELLAGADVVRLNLRDHGNTHHLNRDIFHSCRLPEVIGAVADIAGRFAPKKVSLVGFSLGGNFMLRVAASADPRLQSLHAVVAVSPVLDPANTLTALERMAISPLFREQVDALTASQAVRLEGCLRFFSHRQAAEFAPHDGRAGEQTHHLPGFTCVPVGICHYRRSSAITAGTHCYFDC
jgi:predicted alpha/beta-fold hydrolase